MERVCALKTIYASKRQHNTKPAWRMACMGLNVEAKCLNSRCEAFASRVRCQKGFGVFNVAEPVPCPLCKRGAAATRIGLIGCQWMIEGSPGDTPVDVMNKWSESSCDEYQRFDLDGGWNSLVVTTKGPETISDHAVRDVDMPDLEYDAENCAAIFGTLKLTTSAKL